MQLSVEGGSPVHLVYDIGMNNGDDTAFYLSKGYSVVAVEASPLLVEAARLRFQQEIEMGRLEILEVAIADKTGRRDFWVCEDLTEWNSLDRHLTARTSKGSRSIAVDTVPFSDILSRRERPWYVKIDIEGSDALCLKALDNSTSPTYISAETECSVDARDLDRDDYLYILRLMNDRGYDSFKLVHQSFLVPINQASFELFFDRDYRIAVRLDVERRCNWQFSLGSSGPFGEDIPGLWMRYGEAVEVYSAFRERLLSKSISAPLQTIWCDWHATTS